MTNTASDNKEQIVFVDRRGTDSSKWDNLKSTFGRSDLQAMWIADMDFRVPDCVVSAIEDYMKTGVFGYYVPRPSYHQAFIDWERKYHGYQVKEEWLRFAPGVVPAFNWFLQVFTEPGDAVIVQTPVYYPFMHAVKNNSRRLVCCDLINTGGIYTVDFADFEKKIVENAAHLAHCLTKEGFDLVGGGTDNHLLLLDLRSMNITGKELERRLDEVYITVNKNAIPDDPQKPFVTSGIRVGTPYVTSRGFGKEEMEKIARWIYLAATDFENAADQIRAEVNETCAKFPLYE